MKIKITALDTLFFRDGKPFGMREETSATGQFPPMPSVFYGAIRSLYFSIFPEAFAKINENDPTENLVINEISLWQDAEQLFPCPGDLVEIKEKDKVELLSLETSNIISSYPLSHLLKSEKQVSSLIGEALLTENQFKNEYLFGETPRTVIKLDKLILSEPKVGIGRNNITHTTEEGQLYRVGMHRLETKNNEAPLEFFIDFEGLDFQGKLPENGFLKLGAENKIAALKLLPKSTNNDESSTIKNYFKLVLSTPAIFKNGWHPDFIDSNFEGNFQNSKVKLIAATTGKSISVGGYDMKKKRPKPMFKALPAGTTFFFKIMDNSSIEQSERPIKLKSINGLEKQGFGVAYIGSLQIKSQA